MGKLNLKSLWSFVPAIALSTPVFAQAAPGWDGYRGHMWGDGFGAGFMGFGMMFLFWGGIIFLAVLAMRWFATRDGNVSRRQSALDILKDRLAKGEIDTEDYEARRKVLEA